MSVDSREAATRRLEDDLWVLDTVAQGTPGVIASYLLEGAQGIALVDVGSAATLERLLAAIRSAGHDLRELHTIVLTHVHLDHAGATGSLIALAPHARVLVHPLGRPHLIDPSRLIASASRIYGDRMAELWGDMLPVPADRVTEIADNEVLCIGRRTLTALHTPGHAVHHIAYHDPQGHALFAGDVAGVRLESMRFVRPPTPPPDLDLEAWSTSIARLSALQLDRLYLPHFGVARMVAAHLGELEARLYAWGELIVAGMRAGKESDALAHDLAVASEPALGRTPAAQSAQVSRRYEIAANYLMSAQGYERYFRQRHPERLEP